MDILFTFLFLLFIVMIFIIPAFVLLVLSLAIKVIYDNRKADYDIWL